MKKKDLCDTEKSSSHPPSSQNQAKQAMPESPAQTSKKAALTGDHKKAAILPRNSCAPSNIPPSFMGDLFSFGLAGSICQPFIRSLHSPCGGSGLCHVKPR